MSGARCQGGYARRLGLTPSVFPGVREQRVLLKLEPPIMKCPDCGTEILGEVKPCPHCNSDFPATAPLGQPNHSRYTDKAIFWFALCGAIILLAALVLAATIPATTDRHSLIGQNQAAAIGSLRILNNAARYYRSKYGKGFPQSRSALGPPQEHHWPDAEAADIIGKELASGVWSGYTFIYTPAMINADGEVESYTIQAHWTYDGTKGFNQYFTDQTGVIRFEKDKFATEHSPPLPNL